MSTSKTIQIPAHDFGSFGAYIALPAQTPAPAVILIQEIFGVNAEMREKCDAMAAQGYVAVCPDLFWRIEPGIELADSVPEQLQRAFSLFGQFDTALGMADLKSTLSFLRGHKAVSGKVACLGYCLGGKLAYMMACETDVDASVAYYGVAIEMMLDKAVGIKNPLLLHIAEKDQFVPSEAQESIQAALAGNPHVRIHSYPDAEHAFARGGGMHYDAGAANLANERTADFLKKVLG
ncbi:MAG: dienelactone hydrolase family protein [Alphaproteobacteria bacterium]|nr:dienelactone hydrolase family protein [Alphaproteobacteria bacterium]